MADHVLVVGRDGAGEVVGGRGVDDRYGAAAEAGPGHACAEAGLVGHGRLDHRVQRVAGDFVVVAEAGVALGHQHAQGTQLPPLHRLDCL